MTLRDWMTAAVWHWNGLVTHRSLRSGDFDTGSPVSRAATALAADVSGPRLRTIQDELNTLAETQRLLAILAATAAREGDAQESPWVNLAERARRLASRAEHASETLAGALRSCVGRDGFE